MVVYDIAVVGGGPAGLSAAAAAAKAGGRVILLEKDEGIGQSVRTSGVTWIDEIEKLGISKEHYNPIKNFSFVSNSNSVIIKGAEPRACVLNVRGAYQHLAELAAEAGAELMVRSKVTNASIPSEGEGNPCRLRSSTPRGEIEFECRTIVDASGFNSFIARSLGLVKEWTRYGIGAEYECYCENLDLDTWVLMVGSKYSDAGYAWVFPVSESRARIGVGVGRPESKSDPVEKLNQILDGRPEPLNQIGKIQPIELHRGFIPNDGPRAPMAHNKLLMVGDCAGQSNPLVLEGIRYAIEYGRLAGKIAMKYVSQNCNTDILVGYERMWKEKNQKSIASAQRVQRRWIGLSDEEWNHEIDILREMSIDEFIDFIKADFGICKLMKFGVNHPKAAYRQLLGLIKNA